MKESLILQVFIDKRESSINNSVWAGLRGRCTVLLLTGVGAGRVAEYAIKVLVSPCSLSHRECSSYTFMMHLSGKASCV